MKKEVLYFNTPAAGLIEPEIAKANDAFYSIAQENTSSYFEWWNQNKLPEIKALTADFLEADMDEVALVPNTSYAFCSLVLSLPKDKRVLMYEKEYPSLQEPFKINGFDIKYFSDQDGFGFDIEEIKKQLIREKIDLLVLSHVQFLSGYIFDIRDLGSFCSQNGILIFVDATQSLGAEPISFRDAKIDVLIGSTYKWMNAGYGTGIMLVRKDFLEKHPPTIGGYNSYVLQKEQWIYKASIRSYEPGHQNIPGLNLLELALRDKISRGIENISSNNRSLCQEFISGLKPLGIEVVGPTNMKHRSALLFLKGGEALYDYLISSGVTVALREGKVRLGFHYHNQMEEVRKLLKILEGAPKN